MTKTELARILRPIIESAMQSIEDDATAVQATNLYPAWQPNTEYIAGKKVRYQDILYSVLQNHTSQANWTPDVAVSLFARVIYEENQIKPWEQPDSTNCYPLGAKVTHNGFIWESDYDNNSWEPGVFGWHKVNE